MDKNQIVGCEITECGLTPNGLRICAITDVLGAQVVVERDQESSDSNLLSQPLTNHQAAISLGKNIAEHGVNIYNEWRGVVDSLSEIFEAVALAGKHRTG